METIKLTQLTLEELYEQARMLSDEELDLLEQRVQGIRKWRAFDRAFASLREGLTEEEIAEIAEAMNGKVI